MWVVHEARSGTFSSPRLNYNKRERGRMEEKIFGTTYRSHW